MIGIVAVQVLLVVKEFYQYAWSLGCEYIIVDDHCIEWCC